MNGILNRVNCNKRESNIMKKFFIMTLLIFSVSCSSIVCLALDDFEYGINADDESFNGTVIYQDEKGELLNVTTYDFVPILSKSIKVPVGKNVSALGREFCSMLSGGYDLTGAILEAYCGDNSNYSLTVTAGKESITAASTNGTVMITGIPEREFSAHISNKDDVELSCETYLMGIGSDTTPEEGFNINLSCYDKLPSGGSRLRGLGLLLLSILFAL